MNDEDRTKPTAEQRVAYQADEDPAPVAPPAPPPLTAGPDGANNRGRPDEMTAAGEVTGSGASAGGGGTPEDLDSDPQGGGGAARPGGDADHGHGGDGRKHNSA